MNISLKGALDFFGLSVNYTEEDLKRANRRLTKKWHPDANVGKSAEELKECEIMQSRINEMHEFLRKRLKNKKVSFATSDTKKTNNQNTSSSSKRSESPFHERTERPGGYDVKTATEEFNRRIFEFELNSLRNEIICYSKSYAGCYLYLNRLNMIHTLKEVSELRKEFEEYIESIKKKREFNRQQMNFKKSILTFQGKYEDSEDIIKFCSQYLERVSHAKNDDELSEIKKQFYRDQKREIEKYDFKCFVESQKNIILEYVEKYPKGAGVQNVCNEFITKLNMSTSKLEIAVLMGKFKSMVENAINVYYNSSKQRVFNTKNSCINFYLYRYNEFVLNNPNKIKEATELFYKVTGIICYSSSYNFQSIIEKLSNITFSDIDNDLKFLENLKVEPEIFISKETGEMIFIEFDGQLPKITSMYGCKEIQLDSEDFQNNYISLREFLERADYVGDREVKTVEVFNGRYIYGDLFPGCNFVYRFNDLVLQKSWYLMDTDVPHCFDVKVINRDKTDYRLGELISDRETARYRDKDVCFNSIMKFVKFYINEIRKIDKKSGLK